MTEERTKKYSFARFFPLGSENWLVFKYPYLRESYQSGRKVSDILLEAIPKTGILALASMGLATILGIFLGVVASLKQNSWFDNVSVVLSVLGYSLPSYVAGILLALLFGYVFADYTGLNVQGSLIELDDLGEEHLVWKNLILPAIAIGLRPVAIITQLTRSSMLEVLSQDYIRTAKAKGLSYYVVVVRHALRNALNPVVTAVSGWFASLLAGAFFVESVFNFKGIGDVMVTALLNFDIPVVLGAVLFTAAIFVVVNLLADVLYALFDPRVRFS
jgi:peptide/nickel transport system permease protein